MDQDVCACGCDVMLSHPSMPLRWGGKKQPRFNACQRGRGGDRGNASGRGRGVMECGLGECWKCSISEVK